MLIACLLGAVLGFRFGRRTLEGDQYFDLKCDNNGDGSPDAEYYHEKGYLVRAVQDRNFDGKWDYFEWFSEGVIDKAESDDDFDGRIDGWMSAKSGNFVESKHDVDGNGEMDVILTYRHGLVHTAVCRPNGATNHMRVEFYRNGVLNREYRDVDGDGLLDTLVIRDQFGNEAREEKLAPAIAPSQLKSE